MRVLRRALSVLALVGGCTGAASASSFVELGAPRSAASPSFVVLGQTADPVDVVTLPAPASDPDVALGEVDPAPPHDVDSADSSIVTLSRSVIAMGEPDVADEKVAAIKDKPWRRDPVPMVIRGGFIGDAYGPPASPAARAPKAADEQAGQQSSGESGQPEQPAVPSQPAPYAAKPK